MQLDSRRLQPAPFLRRTRQFAAFILTCIDFTKSWLSVLYSSLSPACQLHLNPQSQCQANDRQPRVRKHATVRQCKRFQNRVTSGQRPDSMRLKADKKSARRSRAKQTKCSSRLLHIVRHEMSLGTGRLPPQMKPRPACAGSHPE